jgi:hypothetical protein
LHFKRLAHIVINPGVPDGKAASQPNRRLIQSILTDAISSNMGEKTELRGNLSFKIKI